MIILVFLGYLLVSTACSLYFGWMMMLAVGVIHHEWLPMVPTLGYWWAVVIVALIRAAFQPLGSDDK